MLFFFFWNITCIFLLQEINGEIIKGIVKEKMKGGIGWNLRISGAEQYPSYCDKINYYSYVNNFV